MWGHREEGGDRSVHDSHAHLLDGAVRALLVGLGVGLGVGVGVGVGLGLEIFGIGVGVDPDEPACRCCRFESPGVAGICTKAWATWHE